jgi:hypothetical protein
MKNFCGLRGMWDVDSGGFGVFGLGLLLEFGGVLILGWKWGTELGVFTKK